MQKNLVIFIVIFVLLCFSLNCTFPLHRDKKTRWSFDALLHRDRTQTCDPVKQIQPTERIKKMASNLQYAIRKIKDVTQDFGKDLNSETGKPINDEDKRHYEQLVIMKKYPYLDLKEFELKFGPSLKARYASETDSNLVDPNIVEVPPTNCIDVEIFNRGLSGFSVPFLRKHAGSSSVVKNLVSDEKKLPKESVNQDTLDSLRADVELFFKQIFKNK